MGKDTRSLRPLARACARTRARGEKSVLLETKIDFAVLYQARLFFRSAASTQIFGFSSARRIQRLKKNRRLNLAARSLCGNCENALPQKSSGPSFARKLGPVGE